MKLRDILRVGATVAGAINPGVGLAIGAVNALLPDDKKLSLAATGNDVSEAINTLPLADQAALLEKELDVEMVRLEKQSDVYKAMSQADGQSTRPRIALMMGQLVVVGVTLMTLATAWALIQGQEVPESLWLVFGTLTAIPAFVLRAYFGDLSKEQARRAESVSGVVRPGSFAGLFGKVK